MRPWLAALILSAAALAPAVTTQRLTISPIFPDSKLGFYSPLRYLAYLTDIPGYSRTYAGIVLRNGIAADNVVVFDSSGAVLDTLYHETEQMDIKGIFFHPQFRTNRRFYLQFSDGFSEFLAKPDAIVNSGLNARFMAAAGTVTFGPDGYLYMAMSKSSGSEIWRVDVDHRSADSGFSIPKDNPFADSSNPAARPVWAAGFHAVGGLSFNPKNGALWSVDNPRTSPAYQPQHKTEINTISRGGFYGYPTLVGTEPGTDFYSSGGIFAPKGTCPMSVCIPPRILLPDSQDLGAGGIGRSDPPNPLDGIYFVSTMYNVAPQTYAALPFSIRGYRVDSDTIDPIQFTLEGTLPDPGKASWGFSHDSQGHYYWNTSAGPYRMQLAGTQAVNPVSPRSGFDPARLLMRVPGGYAFRPDADGRFRSFRLLTPTGKAVYHWEGPTAAAHEFRVPASGLYCLSAQTPEGWRSAALYLEP